MVRWQLHDVVFCVILLSSSFSLIQASYEDVRCKCVCPNPSIVNGSSSDRKLYIANLLPPQCNCVEVVVPELPADFKRAAEFCPHCTCKFESRNTTTIKVVVVLVVCVIFLLVIYMVFLSLLEPFLSKRAAANVSYQQQTDDEDDVTGRMSGPLSERGGVLNRVGSRQDRWKQQVMQQRANIYVRHTMLN